jgi:hypothetical protein
MSCDLRCEHRILSEDRVPVSKLVSLDVLRERVPPGRLMHLRDRVCTASSLTEEKFDQDPFGASVEWASRAGELPLFVCDQYRVHAYRVRPGAISQNCSCWSLSELVCDGIFAPKASKMLNRSLDVLLDGQPGYTRQIDFKRALALRPPSQKIICVTVGKVIVDAIEAEEKLTNNEIVERVRAHPDCWEASGRTILHHAKTRKPKGWKKSGPKRKSIK